MQIGDSIFSNWTIKSILGQGGFATVYEIEREEFGRVSKAAAKVMYIEKPHIDSPIYDFAGMSEDEVSRIYYNVIDDLVDECVLLEKMKGDSHIVSYEDHEIEFDENENCTISIRMELLTPLNKYVRKNVFTLRDIVEMGVEICEGLETCAKNNIIHRDIKPSNIYVTDIGTFKLGDFGISKSLEENHYTNSQKGTRTYMAPEVYRGESYGVSTDIYCLGIVLYRLLNENKLPFVPIGKKLTATDRDEAIKRRMSGEVIPPPVNASDYLAKVIGKAIEYFPEDRYSSATEFKAALEELLDYHDEEDEIENIDGETPVVGRVDGETGSLTEASETAPERNRWEEGYTTMDQTVYTEYSEFAGDDESTIILPENQKKVEEAVPEVVAEKAESDENASNVEETEVVDVDYEDDGAVEAEGEDEDSAEVQKETTEETIEETEDEAVDEIGAQEEAESENKEAETQEETEVETVETQKETETESSKEAETKPDLEKPSESDTESSSMSGADSESKSETKSGPENERSKQRNSIDDEPAIEVESRVVEPQYITEEVIKPATWKETPEEAINKAMEEMPPGYSQMSGGKKEIPSWAYIVAVIAVIVVLAIVFM